MRVPPTSAPLKKGDTREEDGKVYRWNGWQWYFYHLVGEDPPEKRDICERNGVVWRWRGDRWESLVAYAKWAIYNRNKQRGLDHVLSNEEVQGILDRHPDTWGSLGNGGHEFHHEDGSDGSGDTISIRWRGHDHHEREVALISSLRREVKRQKQEIASLKWQICELRKR